MKVKLVISLGALVCFILFIIFINNTSIDKSYGKLNSEQKNTLITIEHLPPIKPYSVQKKVKIGQQKNSEKGNVNLTYNQHSNIFNKEKNSIRISSTEDKLDHVLTKVPSEYHSAFKWPTGFDKELIDEYIQVIEDQELLPFDEDLVALLTDFIFTHEMAYLLEIEKLSCHSLGCEIYGAELSSGTWSMIINAAGKKSWWPFSTEITRSAAVIDGRMHFMTIIKK